MRIGFIGLGNMGAGMAANLMAWCRANDHELYVHDINPDAVARLTVKGANSGTNTAGTAAASDILFTSLPSATEIGLLAPDILSSLPEGAVWFETSTNELAEWVKIKSRAPDYLTLVDAPVTGGSEGAAAGTLTMLLGIDADVLENHKEMLGAFTAKAVRMGPSGAGYVAKLCQLHLNYLVAQGIGETLMLAAKADLDLETLHGVLMKSCAQSYVVDNYIPKVLDGSYDPSFKLGLALKDMRLISQLGDHLGAPLPLGDQVYEAYKAAEATYGFDVPHLQIVKLIEDTAKQPLRAASKRRGQT